MNPNRPLPRIIACVSVLASSAAAGTGPAPGLGEAAMIAAIVVAIVVITVMAVRPKRTRGNAHGAAGQAPEPATPRRSGELIAIFKAPEAEPCARAIEEMTRDARKGDRSGLDVLESYIHSVCTRGADCRFYTTTGMSVIFSLDTEQAVRKLVDYAKGDGLFAHTYEVQTMLNPLALAGALERAQEEIMKSSGWMEARAFELLKAQMDIAALYKSAKTGA